MTLAEKLRARIEFDGKRAREHFWIASIADDQKADAHSYECGADFEHARLRPLLDALIEVADALEKIQNFETLDGDKYNSYEAGWFGVAEFAGDALARLNKLVSEGDE